MTHEIQDSRHDRVVWVCPACSASNVTVIDPETAGDEVTLVCGDCGGGEIVGHP